MKHRSHSRLPLVALSLAVAGCAVVDKVCSIPTDVFGVPKVSVQRIDNPELAASSKDRGDAFRVVVVGPALSGGHQGGLDLVESAFAKAGFVPVAGTTEQLAVLRTREPAGDLAGRVEFREEDKAALRGCDYVVYSTIRVDQQQTNGSSVWSVDARLRVFWIRTGEVVLSGTLQAKGGTQTAVTDRAAEALASELTKKELWGARKG